MGWIEPVPNFQCPKCGKVSVVRCVGLDDIALKSYEWYECLACSYKFGKRLLQEGIDARLL